MYIQPKTKIIDKKPKEKHQNTSLKKLPKENNRVKEEQSREQYLTISYYVKYKWIKLAN